VQSLQYAARATARTSFVLFLVVFTAVAFAKLLPSPLTRALARKRRYIGLSFAAYLMILLLTITSFATLELARVAHRVRVAWIEQEFVEGVGIPPHVAVKLVDSIGRRVQVLREDFLLRRIELQGQPLDGALLRALRVAL
jgi:hypothetical protein